jgi:hypothetical protein
VDAERANIGANWNLGARLLRKEKMEKRVDGMVSEIAGAEA